MIIYKSELEAIGGDETIQSVMQSVRDTLFFELGVHTDEVSELETEDEDAVVTITMKNGRKFALMLAEIV